MSINNPTYTIFKSNKISYEYDETTDNRYVKAIEDIKLGDILLIEHGLYDDIKDDYNIITNTVLYNKSLFEELYPRKCCNSASANDWQCVCENSSSYIYDYDKIKDGSDNQQLSTIISLKLEKNLFKHSYNDKDYYTLLKDGVKFNHSKTPNANYHNIKIDCPNGLSPIMIFYFVAYRDITRGEEITTNYGNDYFKEDTDLTDYNNKLNYCFKKNYKSILKRVDTYMTTSAFNDVMFCHQFMKNGLIYVWDREEYIGLPKLSLIIHNDITKDITITEKNKFIEHQIYLVLTTLKTKHKLTKV